MYFVVPCLNIVLLWKISLNCMDSFCMLFRNFKTRVLHDIIIERTIFKKSRRHHHHHHHYQPLVLFLFPIWIIVPKKLLRAVEVQELCLLRITSFVLLCHNVTYVTLSNKYFLVLSHIYIGLFVC